jgi:hypothetical protein
VWKLELWYDTRLSRLIFHMQKIIKHVPHAEILALYALRPDSKMPFLMEIVKSAVGHIQWCRAYSFWVCIGVFTYRNFNGLIYMIIYYYNMYVYICVCVYVCIYVYMYVYIYIYVYIYTIIHIYVYIFICIILCIYVYIYLNIYTSLYMYLSVYKCTLQYVYA